MEKTTLTKKEKLFWYFYKIKYFFNWIRFSKFFPFWFVSVSLDNDGKIDYKVLKVFNSEYIFIINLDCEKEIIDEEIDFNCDTGVNKIYKVYKVKTFY